MVETKPPVTKRCSCVSGATDAPVRLARAQGTVQAGALAVRNDSRADGVASIQHICVAFSPLNAANPP